jgi:hypothetical protein
MQHRILAKLTWPRLPVGRVLVFEGLYEFAFLNADMDDDGRYRAPDRAYSPS